MRVTSTASARDSGGRIEGRRRASIVLPTPGGPESSRLCAAGGGDGQRLDDVGVAADVGEVEVALGERERRSRRRSGGGGRSPPRRISATCARLLAPSTSSPSTSAASSARCAGPRARRAPRARAPSATASAPRHGRISPAEPELAEDRVALERLGRDVAAGGEDRARDGEVEARAGLAHRRRREVDRDALERELEARVEDRRPHALARLAHGAVGQADDREVGQARAHVDLDRDAPRIESVDGEGGDAGEHGGHARPRAVTVEGVDCNESAQARRAIRRHVTARCAELAQTVCPV